jgi:serine/threonine protein kinase
MATLLKKISAANYLRDGPIWNKLSDEAKDLIQRMLCVDPVERITPLESLEHIWFK